MLVVVVIWPSWRIDAVVLWDECRLYLRSGFLDRSFYSYRLSRFARIRARDAPKPRHFRQIGGR